MDSEQFIKVLKEHVKEADIPEAVVSAMYHYLMNSPSPLTEALWTGTFSFVSGAVMTNNNATVRTIVGEMLLQSVLQAARAKATGKDPVKYAVDDTAVQALHAFYADPAWALAQRALEKIKEKTKEKTPLQTS